MPTLNYSNYLEKLIPSLVQNLKKKDPFLPNTIVVPNFNLQKWLSFELAKAQGIAANLQFKTLEEAIADACLESQKSSESPVKILDDTHIQGMLVALLKNKVLKEHRPEWRHLKAYIQSDVEVSQEALDIRIFQLAGRIQVLFRNYSYHRPDMLALWKKGELCFAKTLVADTERWQQRLWLELYGKSGFLASHSESMVSLPDLVDRFHPSPQESRKSLHVFGISYISLFHRNALSKLDQHNDVFVYALNPCMEFWEDLKADWEIRREARKNLLIYKGTAISVDELEAGELLQNSGDTSLLQMWGRPGRENIRLLNELSGWVFHDHFHDPRIIGKTTLLQQIQYDMLTREPKRETPLDMEQDYSLRVLACPSVKRECEIVANEIWDRLANDPTLKLNEIGVIVPSMELYQTDLELCFQRIHRLPYNLIDGTVSSAGRLREGVLKLFKLGFGEYSRKDIFEILAHPNFIAKFGAENIDVEQWLQWTETTGIFYGIDHPHNQANGFRHLSKDLYNWDQGLHRVALGMFLKQKTEPFPETYQVHGEKYLPLSLEESQFEEALHFITTIRSLIADTRKMPEWSMSAERWALYLKELLNTYFAPAQAVEHSDFSAILKDIDRMATLDQILGEEATPWTYPTFFSFVEQTLSQVTVKRGHYLADGITISSFLPMRPIPFKALFILGLGEGQFPKPFKKDNLDLREANVPLKRVVFGKRMRERNIGDVSNAEKDKYMFLESLISTRNYLGLSYVSRNQHSQDQLEPSSIVQTLKEIVETQYLAKGESLEFVEHPLKSYDPSYFPELQDSTPAFNPDLISFDHDAFQQAKALQMRESLENIPPLQLKAIFNQVMQKQGVQPTPAPEDSTAENEEEATIIYFNQIRAFLECPLQGTAKRKLGLQEDDEEDLKTFVDEPFETEFLQENLLLKLIFSDAIDKASQDWEKLYDHQIEIFELSSQSPTGILKSWNRNRHLQQLEAWYKNIQQELSLSDWGSFCEQMSIARFGRALEGEPVQETLLPIPLELVLKSGQMLSIELQGRTHWVYDQKEEGWHSLYLTNFNKKPKEKHFLRAFLDMIFQSAAGLLEANRQCYAHLISTGLGEKRSVEFKSWSKQKSINYLASLTQAMLEEEFDFLMPIEALFTTVKSQLPYDAEDFHGKLSRAVQQLLNDPMASFSSLYGPVRDLEQYPVPSAAFEFFQKRWMPFFTSIQIK